MGASIAVIVIDCRNPPPVADFWKTALGYEVASHGGTWIKLRDPQGAGLPLAIDPVPEAKVVKNRLHLDLKPSDTMEAEVVRLEQLGAQTIRELPGSHTVMQDPEGNEFCVVQAHTLV